MSKRPGKNKANLEETHRIFLEIAREEFAEFGYADASTSRIVQKSGMARGSLYYHFGDKHGLFKAVYEQMMFESADTIGEVIKSSETKWDALLNGAQGFLDLCLDETYRKITLIEAQAATSYKERLAVHEKTLLGHLRKLIPELLKDGYFKGHTEDTISVFIFGILAEIGRTIDSSSDIKGARMLFGDAFNQTMRSMAP